MGADLLLGDSNMYSCDNELETRQKSMKSHAQETSELVARRRNQKEEDRIVNRFKVISA